MYIFTGTQSHAHLFSSTLYNQLQTVIPFQNTGRLSSFDTKVQKLHKKHKQKRRHCFSDMSISTNVENNLKIV